MSEVNNLELIEAVCHEKTDLRIQQDLQEHLLMKR